MIFGLWVCESHLGMKYRRVCSSVVLEKLLIAFEKGGKKSKKCLIFVSQTNGHPA